MVVGEARELNGDLSRQGAMQGAASTAGNDEPMSHGFLVPPFTRPVGSLFGFHIVAPRRGAGRQGQHMGEMEPQRVLDFRRGRPVRSCLPRGRLVDYEQPIGAHHSMDLFEESMDPSAGSSSRRSRECPSPDSSSSS